MEPQFNEQQKKEFLAALTIKFREDYVQAIKNHGYFMYSTHTLDNYMVEIDYFPGLYRNRETGLYEAHLGLNKIEQKMDGKYVQDYDFEEDIRKAIFETVLPLRFDSERNLITNP